MAEAVVEAAATEDVTVAVEAAAAADAEPVASIKGSVASQEVAKNETTDSEQV